MYYVYVCMYELLIHMAKNSIQCPAAQYNDLTVVHFSFGTFDYFLASLAEIESFNGCYSAQSANEPL